MCAAKGGGAIVPIRGENSLILRRSSPRISSFFPARPENVLECCLTTTVPCFFPATPRKRRFPPLSERCRQCPSAQRQPVDEPLVKPAHPLRGGNAHSHIAQTAIQMQRVHAVLQPCSESDHWSLSCFPSYRLFHEKLYPSQANLMPAFIICAIQAGSMRSAAPWNFLQRQEHHTA